MKLPLPLAKHSTKNKRHFFPKKFVVVAVVVFVVVVFVVVAAAAVVLFGWLVGWLFFDLLIFSFFFSSHLQIVKIVYYRFKPSPNPSKTFIHTRDKEV